ncbi:hypothetical protein [Microviridae sp.]|nr:hypothetical protein [Microviridae sp.]
MKVRPCSGFTILTTHIKTDRRLRILTQPLHKTLKIRIIQRTTSGQIGIIIGKCNEGITFVKRGFVETTHSPLPGALKATSNTLTTGQLKRTIYTLLRTTYKLYRAIHHANSRHGMVTRH